MSSPKRKPLDFAALGAAAIPQPDPVHEANRNPAPKLAVAQDALIGAASTRAPSRKGLVQIQGYFQPETRRRLKMLAARMDKTQEELLGQALDQLFEKYDA